ncbi:hypothetical protein GF362_01055 [Candidatus Dojkabacteria bacterium]|nr:hypothetical protein [Candidatus Dojkabacteria bacterium]
MITGFSTGTFHKNPNVKNKNSNEILNLFLKHSFQAVEICCLDCKELFEINTLNNSLLKRFSYKSLHAPALDFVYEDNKTTLSILNKVRDLHCKYDFNLIVFHPDRIKNISILNSYNDLPIAFENMNSRKKTGKTFSQLQKTFSNNNYRMVLDLQHAYSNDTSMKLASDLYKQFKPRIAEIHISGQTHIPGQHTPLFKSKQVKIIKSIPNLKIPIIIESPVNNRIQIQKEYNYITENIVK